MRKEVLEILAHDLELKTIFARGVSGSIVLDIIPSAVAYLNCRPEFEQMYLQDVNGSEFTIPQGGTIEQAVQNWQLSKNRKSTLIQSNKSLESVKPEGFMFM